MELELNRANRRELWIYLIIAVLCLIIFLIPFSNADELWNYNFARGIVNGLKPYTDMSMIPTPFSAYISAVFLLLFGKGLFAYRIAGYVLMYLTFSIFYKLNKIILNDTLYAFMAVLMMYIMNYYFYIYNYNNLSVCLVLLMLLMELYNHLGAGKQLLNYMIGILSGCLPIIKQNTGAILFLVNIIICMCYIKKDKVHKQIYLARIGLSIVPGILYLSYLIGTDSFTAFLDYAVLGIGTFSHRILLHEYMMRSPINMFVGLLLIIIILYVAYKLLMKKEGTRVKYVFAIYAIAWLVTVSYPLCDEQHLFVGMIPLISLLFLFIKDSEKLKTGFFYINLVVVTFVILISISSIPNAGEYKISQIHNYEGIPMSKDMENSIETVCDYIFSAEEDGTKVYIANEYAAMYMIPLDKYTKNWDLLLVGNVGTTSIDEMLDVEENSVFLVLKDEYELNRQAHYELINYIKENYSCVDEVRSFEVYKKLE